MRITTGKQYKAADVDTKPDLLTRLFNVWFLLSRPMTLGVRALAFDAEGRILLVKHTYVSGWHLPGGGIDAGETAVEGLEKELREEANVVTGDAPVLLSVHQNTRVTRRDHVIVYRCDNVRQLSPKIRDREIIAADFFALDALPEGATKSTLRRIAECRGDAEPDPYW
jgi:ADP-ribose pyrophosphatase YjhB (NUDIX family)